MQRIAHASCILTAGLIVLVGSMAFAGTVNVSGTIGVDTTWTSTDTVIVTATVTVSGGGKLTIQPGTVVLFSPGTNLIVQKTLSALGDSANPIIFTSRSDTAGGSPAAGDWAGLSLYDYNNTNTMTGSFRYCSVRYASSGINVNDYNAVTPTVLRHVTVEYISGNAVLMYGNHTLDSSTIRNFGQFGLYSATSSDGYSLNLSECTITQEGAYYQTGSGIYVQGNIGLNLSGCSITDCRNGVELRGSSNYRPGIDVNGCTITGNYNIGVYFHAANYNYYTPYGTIHNSSIINGAADIYLEACSDTGTVIDARNNWWGTADGRIIADRVRDHTDYTSTASVDYSSPLDAPYPAGQPVAGYLCARLTNDTTLTAAGGPYYLIGAYTVDRGVRLDIEAGATFYAIPAAILSVEGQIRALGDSANHITFTSTADTAGGGPTGGNWTGVRLVSTSDSAECVLRYCDISYSGHGVYIYGSTSPYPPRIENCLVRKTSSYGVYLRSSAATIDSCEIVDFVNAGTYIYGDNAIRSQVTIANTSIHLDTVTIGRRYPGVWIGYNVDVEISNSDIFRCLYSIQTYVSTGYDVPFVEIEGCNFYQDSSYAVHFNNSSSVNSARGRLRNCNIFENGSVGIYAGVCNNAWTGEAIDARNNWWGTAEPFAVHGKIYDFTDNQSSPTVDCSAPLNAPYPSGVPITNAIAGVIDRDTILTAAGSPYYVLGSPQFRRGHLVTIEPGTEFLVAPGTGLFFDGQLLAVGDSLNHIVFSAAADTAGGAPGPGSWKGIDFYTNSDSAECRLEWCDLKWADDALYLTDHRSPYQAIVSNSQFRDMSGAGLVLTNSEASVSKCLFRNFGGYGVFIDGQTAPQLAPVIRECAIVQDTVTQLNVGNGIYARGSIDPLIVGCDISGSANGIYIYKYDNAYTCEFTIDSCDIHDIGQRGIYVTAGTSLNFPVGTVSNSNITNCASDYLCTHYCPDSLTTPGIDARGNWWGTADPYQIAQRVYDFTNNSRYAPANYSMWLDGPAPGGAQLGGQGVLSGVQSFDTTLTLAHSPYRVVGTWLVQQGVQVDVEPAVEFQFAADTRIKVNGTFRAVGDSLNHIRFTSASDTLGGTPQAGDWTGIAFYDGSDAEPCSLRYCDFQYAATPIEHYENRWPWPVRIQDCDFRDLSWSGIYVTNSAPLIERCVIEDFVNSGIYVTGSSSSPAIKNTVIDQDSSIHVGVHGWGIYVYDYGHIEVSGCRVSDLVYGIGLYNHSGTPPTFYIRNSELLNNSTYGLYLYTRLYSGYYQNSPTGTINYCNLTGNSGGSVVASYSNTGSISIDAKHNWWGVTDSATITNNLIFDHYNHSSCPYVAFMPVATSENKQPCPSDFNSSGRTDYDDLVMLGFAFGASSGDDNWLSVCNISQASVSATRVDGFDLALFGSQYGNEGGCYPFSKAGTVPSDGFELIVRSEHESGLLGVTVEPRAPEDYNVLGWLFDMVVDTTRVKLPPDVAVQHDNVIEYGQASGDRYIYSMVSLDGEPIDPTLCRRSIRLTCLDGEELSSITIENAGIVTDGYALAEAPAITIKDPTLPTAYDLVQNYPNPFNPSTTIEYSLPVRADVNLTIINVLGQEVWSSRWVQQEPGRHRVVWNGCDRFGQPVATGVYLYRLESGDYRATRKMLLVK